MLALEPVLDDAARALVARTGVQLLGIEATRRASWPTMRHVFDVGHDAGLFVEVGPYGVEAYGVSYSLAGDACLTAL